MKENPQTIHVVSRAVIIQEGYILLSRTTHLDRNFYFLPGGHVEHGESAYETVTRELKEETGFDLHVKHYLGCLEHKFEAFTGCCHTHEYNFIFEAEGVPHFDEPITEEGSGIQSIWVHLSNWDQLNFHPQSLAGFIMEWTKSPQQPSLATTIIHPHKSQ